MLLASCANISLLQPEFFLRQNTGCVKIYIDSEELLLRRNQQYGYAYPTGEGPVPTLPEKYMDNPILLRGCFVLAVPGAFSYAQAPFLRSYAHLFRVLQIAAACAT